MRKRFARFFLLVAKRLDPHTHIENAQHIEGYDAKKIGLEYVISKKDLQEFRFKDGARMGIREGKRMLISNVRKKIRQHIFACIDANHLIEFNLTEDGKGFKLNGQLRVYVPQAD